MKNCYIKLLSLLLSFVLMATFMPPIQIQAATGITEGTYATKMNEFIRDARWKDYASYGPRSPYISGWSSSGCCAYAADFAAYVYGEYGTVRYSKYFTHFTSAADIRTGDIISIPGHWFVVLERNGNSIRAAEGNVSGKWARITNKYRIDNGQLFDEWNNRFTYIEAGYHYNFSYPIPSKPVLNATATNQNKDVVFSWATTINTVNYDLRIYKEGETTPLKTVYGLTGNSYSYRLPAGKYTANLASVYNAYCHTMSDTIKFTVKNEEHKHSYKAKLIKATTKKNGYTADVCSCGQTKNKKTIYYPQKVTLSKTTYTYNGTAKKPTVKVVGSNGKTISTKYYTVTYAKGRRKAGTYKVTVKFKGNYEGTVTKTFKIDASKHKHKYKKVSVKATLSKNGYAQSECVCGTIKNKKVYYYPSKVTLSSTSYTYDGKVKKPTVKVMGSNKKTISNSNYTVTYAKGRKKAGVYKVTVKFKGNYKGTVTKTFKINNKWTYVSKLPSKVNSTKYEVQYKHTKKTTTTTYVKTGSTYESYKELPTSQTRLLVGYYYFHYCSGSTGQYVNFAYTEQYVHYDSIASDRVTVVSTGTDSDDASIKYYILNWKGTNDPAWCSSGSTCDGSFGSHGTRAKAWYRMNVYQDYKAVKKTQTTESGWTSKKDNQATKVEYRYRKKVS